ncbi:MAG TPA: hypothetical protein VGV63_06145 [Acidimicrobiales bacterium]|nr:hypothetical protein [Acidimicrobiales bacterium]
MHRSPPTGYRCELEGTIASAGFSSGHRFVVGHWDHSPLGPMDDVMWAWPDGVRLLLVGRSEVAELITAVYRFDRVEVVPLRCRMDESVLAVVAGDLRITLRAGRRWPIPLAQLRGTPAARPVERLLARAMLGVRTWGVSPTGVREWYRADEYRRVVAGEAHLGELDLGGLRRFHEPARFGFSEPPRRPSLVRARPLLHDPSGTLAAVVSRSGRGIGAAGQAEPRAQPEEGGD